MTVVRRLLEAFPERRAITYQDVWGKGLDLGGSQTAAGVRVDTTTAMRFTAVYACVRLLAETVASLPADTFRREEGSRRPYRPRPVWLDRPNPDQTRFEVVEQLMASLLLAGDFFGATVWDKRGELAEVWPLSPDTLIPGRDERGLVYAQRNGGRDLRPASRLGGDILHIRAFSMPGELSGLSPIEQARQTIGLGMVAEEFGARFFSQGASPGGIIELPGKPEQGFVDRLKANWLKKHAGPSNAHIPGVLTDGATWKPLTIPPDQAQFLETRKFQIGEIARLFRVPPHMIGDLERATFSNIEHQAIEFEKHSIRPWLERIEQGFDRLLADGVFLKFNADGLLRGDTKGRYEAYQIALDSGFRNPDEVRALEDLPPVPGGLGKKFRQPLNFGPLGSSPTPAKETA